MAKDFLSDVNFQGTVTLTDTDAGSSAAPIIELYRNSSSPADSDYIGQLKFQGENDNDQKVVYAKITAKIGDATDTTEDGIIEVTHVKAGSNNISARWTSDALKLINGTGLEIADGLLTLGSTAVTATAAELNLVDGITAGTISASKAVIVDSNKDITGFRNVTLTGELDAATLDISGDADIDGTLEADAITVNGTALDEFIADTIGAMVTSNTETGVAVTYEDSDNTLDFVIGTLNQDTTGNSATATALETARNIGGVSFDGTGNINLPGVNTSGDQDTSGNSATATALATARNIGGVSFDGTGNIDLPGVNSAGNQNTSGNAATATALETARTINGTSFDGSANITVTAAAGTVTGATLNSGVTASSLTSVGTLTGLGVTGAVTVGVDDTGHDVKFFGATSGSYMEWDESADTLNVVGLMTLHGGTRSVQVTNDSNNANIVVGVGSDTASKRGSIIFERSDGSIASPTAVDDNDYLGEVVFKGYDGDQMVTGARIRALCNGTTGNNDMPTELVFMTTADGASDSTARMTITESGNVGIGDTTAMRALDVVNDIMIHHTDDDHAWLWSVDTSGNCEWWYQNSYSSGDSGWSQKIDLDGDGSTDLTILGGSGSGYTHASIKMKVENDARGAGVYSHNSYNDTTWFWGNPYNYEDSWRIHRKSSTSSLDVSAADVANKLLYLLSNGDLYIDGGYNTFSDSRLKENIGNLSLGLDFVNSLTPREYKRKGRDELHMGFVAQEVAALLPDAANTVLWSTEVEDVSGPEEEENLIETQSLRYTELIAPLVKAVQELTTRVATLEGS